MLHRWFGGLLILGLVVQVAISASFSQPQPTHNRTIIRDEHDFNECVKGCECVYGSNGKQLLNCANMELTDSQLNSLDNNYMPDIIDLSSNSIKFLKASQILTSNQRKNVHTLDLRHNQIKEISMDLFEQFPNLRILYLSHNQLGASLRKETDYLRRLFQMNNPLEELYLDYNSISIIESYTFNEMRILKVLSLDGNTGLNSQYLSFEVASALEQLSINNCGLSTLSMLNYQVLRSLKKLHVSENPITSFTLHPQMTMPNLEILDLSKTHLINLSMNWLVSPTLKQLNMREMPFLFSIQSCAFCKLPNLTSLELQSSSKLESIDASAFGPRKPKLERLNLEHCNLKTLAKEMISWREINDLFIGSNPYVCDEKLAWLINDKTIQIDKVGPEPKCAQPAELANIKLRDVSAIQNNRKRVRQSTQRPVRVTTKANWKPWYKPLPKIQPKQEKPQEEDQHHYKGFSARYPYQYSTYQPTYSPRRPQSLRDKISELLGQLYDVARDLSKDPRIDFAAGFVVGIVAILVLWTMYSLIKKIACFLFTLIFYKIFPSIGRSCKHPRAKRVFMAIGITIVFILFGLIGLLFVFLGFIIYIFCKSRKNGQSVNYYKNYPMTEAEKPEENPNVVSNPVFVYDRETENATIIQ